MPACSQTTAKGTPCKFQAVVGLDRCAIHAGLGTRGRPPLLTEETAEALVSMLRAGNYLYVACRAAGIARQTFQDWMQRGRSEEPEDAYYRVFRERVETARATGQMRHVALISSQAATDWRAAAWLLERQYPELWGAVSVRLRDEAPPPEPVETTRAEPDVFAEIDELAARRRDRAG